MRIHPTEEEITQAITLLTERYEVPSRLLAVLFGDDNRRQADVLLQQYGQPRLLPPTVADLLVRRHGPDLFGSWNRDGVRELRAALLDQLPEDVIRRLFADHPPPNCQVTETRRMVRKLAEKNWHAGKSWARAFVDALGFPAIFAGVVTDQTQPTVDLIEPRREPPKLAPFQERLRDAMLAVLNREAGRNSCVVTLPTGGGKTRVAVEAFIDWMQPRFSDGRYLLWVAQSEELCEQAIACIRQMWSSREYIYPLRVYRCFGGRDLPIDQLAGGAVVASIQQLYCRLEAGDPGVSEVVRRTGALIIDEAHRASTPMYDALYSAADRLSGPTRFPVCGLTATPGRSGPQATSGTQKLVERFEANLITPVLGAGYERNPLDYFREHGYLARAKHIVCRSGLEYVLTDAELKDLKREGDLPDRFRKRLAEDNERNKTILDRLLAIPPGSSALVYACTVEHAHFLATLLSRLGRTAQAVSADTSATVRRGLIAEFKSRRLDFLCNYGVLTTGFDAPKTTHVVLCRPTTSEVLYEQIVGRGLRGPQFGGTEECEVIDFADNIQRLGPPLAYTRFADFWSSHGEECRSPVVRRPSRQPVQVL